MRATATDGGLTVRAVAGSYTVLLGFDLDDPAGCLGFAIHRTDDTEGDAYWLRGMKTFASVVADPEPGQAFPLRHHPVQGFQWGDYTAKPGHEYRYRVVALAGTPSALTELASATVTVIAEDPDDGRHGIWFNRGVAASQAYTRRFGGPPPEHVPDDDPRMAWLSRGLAEAFVDFVGRAEGPEWSLRGAFYEFTWPGGLQAFRAAHLRGVDVELVVHGRDKDTATSGNKDRTAENNREAARDARILGLVRWRRVGNKGALQHNKFMVLSQNNTPVAVWTGSTNLTRGGVYGHSNVAHVIRDPAVAAAFLEYWDRLESSTPTAGLRLWIEDSNPIDLTRGPEPGPEPGSTSVFSPRDTQSTLLQDYADLFDTATSSAHITGAFGLNEVFRTALGRQRAIPRTVLLDKPSSAIPRTDQNVRISAGAHVERDDMGQWARETLAGFNTWVKYVHTKIFMIDPLTDDPIVASGSANYSRASTVVNEENTVLIRGNARVADIYLTEYHRLFMHFVFRRWAQRSTAPPRRLAEDDTWTSDYYDTGHWRSRQRRLFAGT